MYERGERVRMGTEMRIVVAVIAFGRIVKDIPLTGEIRMGRTLLLDRMQDLERRLEAENQ